MSVARALIERERITHLVIAAILGIAPGAVMHDDLSGAHLARSGNGSGGEMTIITERCDEPIHRVSDDLWYEVRQVIATTREIDDYDNPIGEVSVWECRIVRRDGGVGFPTKRLGQYDSLEWAHEVADALVEGAA